jgi:hypothetical protein
MVLTQKQRETTESNPCSLVQNWSLYWVIYIHLILLNINSYINVVVKSTLVCYNDLLEVIFQASSLKLLTDYINEWIVGTLISSLPSIKNEQGSNTDRELYCPLVVIFFSPPSKSTH